MTKKKTEQILDWGREVLNKEIEDLKAAAERLDDTFTAAVSAIRSCKGKVVVTGLGKSGHVGRKISASMASLGIPSFFLHSGEALHGDSGMLSKNDLVIAISNSGKTAEVAAVAGYSKEIGLKVIAMTGDAASPLAEYADIILDIGVQSEADHLKLAPTSSSTVTLALGDALAVAAARDAGFEAEDFAARHSGGSLGNISRAASKSKK